MSAIIFKSAETLSNPKPGTPFLPDISSNLFFDFEASRLGFDDGDPVTSIVGLGEGSLAHRTMSNNFGSGASFPDYSENLGPGGSPCITFNGMQRISNLSSPSTAIFPVQPQPITDFFVYYLDPVAQGSNRRLIGGLSNYIHNILLDSTGDIRLVAGGGEVALGVGVPIGQWNVLGVVFDGANTRVILPNGQIITSAAVGTNAVGGWGYGHNSSTVSAGSGMIGRIAEHKMFTRGFSDTDLLAMHEFLKDKYSI